MAGLAADDAKVRSGDRFARLTGAMRSHRGMSVGRWLNGSLARSRLSCAGVCGCGNRRQEKDQRSQSRQPLLTVTHPSLPILTGLMIRGPASCPLDSDQTTLITPSQPHCPHSASASRIFGENHEDETDLVTAVTAGDTGDRRRWAKAAPARSFCVSFLQHDYLLLPPTGWHSRRCS